MTDDSKVRDYYAEYQEWARLDTAEGRLEFERGLAVVVSYLKPHSRVLDLGGGPGKYAIALAEEGHRIVLADTSPGQLSVARAAIDAAGAGGQIESID